MALIDFIKKNTLLALDAPKRNLLGDNCIGWNRPANAKDEKITLEQAELFLHQDVEKARKSANKFYQLGQDEVGVFLLFYVGRRRWKEMSRLLGQYKDIHTTQDKARVAVELSNSKWFQNNPSLGVFLAKKILMSETEL